MSEIRIQKVLAEAGLASRRAAEEMILDGRVTVNGSLVTELPCFVDPERDDVRLDDRPIPRRSTRKAYFLLNKPRGVVCTQRDPQHRPRAVDLIPVTGDRIYCIGRLDIESTGLIILTNDGELTQYLTHPSHGAQKTYVAEVDGRMTGEKMDKLKAGIYLDGRRTQGVKIKVLRRSDKRSLLEIRISEGRNRQIRRILARVGNKVRRLKRVAIGDLTDKGLKIGHFRILRPYEIAKLRRSVSARTKNRPRTTTKKPAQKATRKKPTRAD